jgi:hypothetical protein
MITFSSRTGELKGKPKRLSISLDDVPAYLRWWPEVYVPVDNLALGERDGIGETYAFLTRGKLSYRLRWNARITDKRRPSSFSIEASGDFVGRAVSGRSSNIRSTWISSSIGASELRSPLLRYLSFLLRPLFRWNHRWAMARGEDRFRRELVRRRSLPDWRPVHAGVIFRTVQRCVNRTARSCRPTRANSPR